MTADGEGISGTNPMHGRLALIKLVIINPLLSRVMSLTVSWLVRQCGGSFVRGLIITNGWLATHFTQGESVPLAALEPRPFAGCSDCSHLTGGRVSMLPRLLHDCRSCIHQYLHEPSVIQVIQWANLIKANGGRLG